MGKNKILEKVLKKFLEERSFLKNIRYIIFLLLVKNGMSKEDIVISYG